MRVIEDKPYGVICKLMEVIVWHNEIILGPDEATIVNNGNLFQDLLSALKATMRSVEDKLRQIRSFVGKTCHWKAKLIHFRV